ncbi:hypothetical protein Y032_0005g2279 [Ancylostoma ceylanicum]|uniref:Uncharacterized protein n=1 Tax=Ancylostoma ceylanicum TaxID=53326 RepID=A0A016VRY6_9BILA|nr:hypothetical protein Y032_0005g2279 [Ancylostoma ceylanicum]
MKQTAIKRWKNEKELEQSNKNKFFSLNSNEAPEINNETKFRNSGASLREKLPQSTFQVPFTSASCTICQLWVLSGTKITKATELRKKNSSKNRRVEIPPITI